MKPKKLSGELRSKKERQFSGQRFLFIFNRRYGVDGEKSGIKGDLGFFREL
jgi:hypothetical protein